MLKVKTKDCKVRVKIEGATGGDVVATIAKLYEVLMENGFSKEKIDKSLELMMRVRKDLENAKSNN